MQRKSSTISVGQKYGRLEVVSVSIRRHYVRCLCQCGTQRDFFVYNIISGKSLSCGCLASDRSSKANTTHGMSRTSIYYCWNTMFARCERRSHSSFRFYGGRGIKVCAGWKEFSKFFADMGDKPSAKHEIDRRNSNGHYSCGHCDECVTNGWPANCRWATKAEQAANMRSNRLVEHCGDTIHIAELSRRTGVDARLIRERLERGWSVQNAISTNRHHVGELAANAKLNDIAVRDIRKRFADGESTKDIAISFGVSRRNVRKVVSRESWAHVG